MSRPCHRRMSAPCQRPDQPGHRPGGPCQGRGGRLHTHPTVCHGARRPRRLAGADPRTPPGVRGPPHCSPRV